jgi:hypothetical protein
LYLPELSRTCAFLSASNFIDLHNSLLFIINFYGLELFPFDFSQTSNLAENSNSSIHLKQRQRYLRNSSVNVCKPACKPASEKGKKEKERRKKGEMEAGSGG